MTHRPFEILVRNVSSNPRPAGNPRVFFYPQTVQAEDVAAVSGSDEHGNLWLRQAPKDALTVACGTLTQARLHWVMSAEGAPPLDDPVASPSMALRMAKAGAHSRGWSMEQVVDAIEPWFTVEEVKSLAAGGFGYGIEQVGEPMGLDKQLVSIAEAFARRGQERSLMSESGLGGKVASRREEAVQALGAKAAPKTGSR